MVDIHLTRQDQSPDRDRRLMLLVRRLPRHVQAMVVRLRRPSSRWVRIPAAGFLIIGSVLFILPVFGLWMLPLGLILLAEDVAPLRRCTDCWLWWIEQRRPHWMGLPPTPGARPASSADRSA